MGKRMSIKSIAWLTPLIILVALLPDMGIAVSSDQKRAEVFVQLGHFGNVTSVAYSPDGRYLASGSIDKTIKIWDAASGREIRTLKGHAGAVRSVAYSPNGRYLASGSDDDTIKIWEAASGREVRTLKGHSGSVDFVAYSPDGRYLASGSGDGCIKLWDPSTGSEIAQLVSFTNGEWVAITPEGYYNASPNGDKHLNVRIGPMKVVGIDQYRATFYRPEIVEARLRGVDTTALLATATKPGSQARPADINDAVDYPPPMVVITTPGNGDSISTEEADVHVIIKDKFRLQKIELFVNGKQLLSPDQRAIVRKKESGGKVSRIFSAALAPGENTILVRAHNNYAFGEDRIILHRVAGKTRTELLPRLFILAVGAADYRHLDPGDQLNYPPVDAAEFAAAFAPMRGRLFSEIHTKVLTRDGDLKPTAANIEDNLGFLGRAGQHDMAILFMAGHGIRDSRGRYYFLPEDAQKDKKGNFRRSTLIKWTDIKDALDVPATMLAFLDTCHSASFFKSGKVRAVDSNLIVRELLEQGTIVFSSSTGSEFSLESSRWRHGAFTFAILEGLQKGAADLINDKRITIKELDTFVSQKVVTLTNGAQHPVTYAPEGYKDFSLWLVGD